MVRYAKPAPQPPGHSVPERVRKVISDLFGREPGPDQTLRDLGADSLDAIELVMLIEEEFYIEIGDDEIAPFHPAGDNRATVTDLIALVESKVAAR